MASSIGRVISIPPDRYICTAHGCEAIVTHNGRDFDGAASFGVAVLTPARGDRSRFEQVLAKVPDVEPAESDLLPNDALRPTVPKTGRRRGSARGR